MSVSARGRTSLADRAYLALKDEIAARQYAPGTRLPGEVQLAQRYAVSRPVLRQALARLRAEGVIASRQGSGTFVASRESAATLGYGPLENLPDVQRCLEFRCTLESDAARRAAMVRDPAACEAIERALRVMERELTTGHLPVEADFAFHLAVAHATHNRFFVMTLEALRPHVVFGINLIRGLATAPLAERTRTVLDEHREILGAIRDGEPQRAHAAMTRHLEAGLARLFGR